MNTITADEIRRRKVAQGHAPVSVLTAYDYPTARLLDECGVDMLLVGDSLGMVVLGYPDTTQVTLDHMTHHLSAVARGAERALIIGDLPYRTYETASQAVETAQALVAAGAHAVKLEGGTEKEPQIRAILEAGIPMVGHLGMLPQSVKEEGGYKKKGKTPAQADRLLEDARCLEAAGCCAIILESVIPATAQLLTEDLAIPTIGIGCGRTTCDGEVAVITDLIGSYPWFVPPFATPRAQVATDTQRAVQEYIAHIGQKVD